MRVLVGCCGFAAARSRTFQTFPAVEIDQSFYRLPKLETARAWRNEAPKGFVYTLKAWQVITHEPSSPTYRKLGFPVPAEEAHLYGSFRVTPPVLRAWDETLKVAKELAAEVILFQCPSTFRPARQSIDNLRAFFQGLQREGFQLAWEPRGDWDSEKIVELCKELGLVHALDPFERPPVAPGPRYFRLHGRTGFGYRFTEKDFAELRGYLAPDETNYVFFNNVTMVEDAERFLKLLGEGERKPAPETPVAARPPERRSYDIARREPLPADRQGRPDRADHGGRRDRTDRPGHRSGPPNGGGRPGGPGRLGGRPSGPRGPRR